MGKDKTQGLEFPTQSGVYIMKDSADKVIYIGKAKNLRNRVRSYFTGGKDIKTTVLVSHVHRIEYIITRNEYEALLLENTLIKKWKPRYNINLKDGKTYPVIRLTAEEYPRVFKTRYIVSDGSTYYGPYPNVASIDAYLELVERLYPLRKCRGPVKHRDHPCLYYHIGRCAGVCAGKTSRQEYDERVAHIKRLLSGETEDIKAELERDMNHASKELRFEKAAEYRDILAAIARVEAEQQVVDFDLDVRDYVGFAAQQRFCTFVVFQMRGGKLLGSDMFRTSVFAPEEEDLTQFILQYYSTRNAVPARLFISRPMDTQDLVHYFRDEHEAEVEILTPESARDASVMRMVEENARTDLEKRIRDRGNLPALQELQRVLELARAPLRIEGFDIAHVGGKHPVASLVSFQNGVPDKSQYRRFHMKSLNGQIDDFESMREVMARRYTRVLNERLPRPDLILVDGGKGQVSAAYGVLESLDMADIPLVGLAKRNEEIFVPHRADPIVLPEGSPPLRVLQHVRDEAHRFATTFRARLQKNDIALDTLEQVPGIGEKRSKRLLQAFGSLETIAETPPDIIAKSCAIPEIKAREIKEVLKSLSEKE